MTERTKPTLPLSELTAITPLDGRYRKTVVELAPYVSEFALIQTRMTIEGRYLIALSDFGVVRKLKQEERKTLMTFGTNLTLEEAQKVKDVEDKTRHDVKAMEIVFRNIVQGTSLENLTEWIHFGLTSEDVNNMAYRLLLNRATQEVCIPTLDTIVDSMIGWAERYKAIPMLGRTHGQAAVPTTLGKEFAVFAQRLNKEVQSLEQKKITGKVTGAVGNLSALQAAFPDKDWIGFSEKFVVSFGFEPNLATTQINPYEDVIAYFQNYQRVNGILLDFDQDMWRYISDYWLAQETKEGEKGSSTMPQKVNPIHFENSEGNLGMANALLEHLCRKLAISRLQRDLSDSTTIRNIGTVLGYELVGYTSALEGLSRVYPNKKQIAQALNSDWTILAEPVQIILRRQGLQDAYELLLKKTRGKHIGAKRWRQLVEALPISSAQKKELLQFTPQNYIGLAVELTERAIQEIRRSRKK